MQNKANVSEFTYMEQDRPVLWASFSGSDTYPLLKGDLFIYNLPAGFYVSADFEGLPVSEQLPFHIHEGLVCGAAGEILLHFPDVMSDKNGKSSMQVYIDKLQVADIAGRISMIHIRRNGKEPEIACAVLQRIL